MGYEQYTLGRTSKKKIEPAITDAIQKKQPLVLNVRSRKKNYYQFIIDRTYRQNNQLYVHLNSRSGLLDGWHNFWQQIDE